MKTVAMLFKKETKGTVVYEDKESDLCKSIYLLKDSFSNGFPKKITLTIDWEE